MFLLLSLWYSSCKWGQRQNASLLWYPLSYSFLSPLLSCFPLSLSHSILSVTHPSRSRIFSRTSRMDASSWRCWRSSLAASWSDSLHIVSSITLQIQQKQLAFHWQQQWFILIIYIFHVSSSFMDGRSPPTVFSDSTTSPRSCLSWRRETWVSQPTSNGAVQWLAVLFTPVQHVCVSSGEAGQYRCSRCCRWKLLHHPGSHLEHHPLLPGSLISSITSSCKSPSFPLTEFSTFCPFLCLSALRMRSSVRIKCLLHSLCTFHS